MIRTNKTHIGKLAEEHVESFLNERSISIIERNLRRSRMEIDLIFKDGIYLVFGEVKYRKTNEYGFSESTLSKGQEDRIKKLAEIYLEENPWSGRIRFDIFALSGSLDQPIIEHFIDAF